MRACAKGYVSGLAPFPARPRQLVVYALVRSPCNNLREYRLPPSPRSISRDPPPNQFPSLLFVPARRQFDAFLQIFNLARRTSYVFFTFIIELREKSWRSNNVSTLLYEMYNSSRVSFHFRRFERERGFGLGNRDCTVCSAEFFKRCK